MKACKGGSMQMQSGLIYDCAGKDCLGIIFCLARYAAEIHDI